MMTYPIGSSVKATESGGGPSDAKMVLNSKEPRDRSRQP